MVKSDIAKIKKEGKTFEIFVNAEKANDLKNGKNIDLTEVFISEEIFSDANKGLKASEHDLKRLFGTNDKLEVCKIIIKQGHVPVTAEMHRKDADQRIKQIISLIHRNAIDPNTGKPHPITRIENAIDETKIRIDNSKSAEEQVKDVLNKLRLILPIKYETREIMIKIPAQFTGKAFGSLKHYGRILGESWLNDGSLNVTIEIPAGMQEELELALNNLTKGQLEITIMRSK